MGRPKDALPVAGRTLLERAVATLAAAGAEPLFCVFGFGDERIAPPPARALTDRRPDRGPLEGLAVALDAAARAGCEILYALPCDTPLVGADFLRWLETALGQADCAVPLGDGGLEPLCAVYRTRLAAAALALAAEGHGSPRALLDRVRATGGRVRLPSVDEMQRAGFDPSRLFLNANTPEELARIRRLLEDLPPRRGP